MGVGAGPELIPNGVTGIIVGGGVVSCKYAGSGGSCSCGHGPSLTTIPGVRGYAFAEGRVDVNNGGSRGDGVNDKDGRENRDAAGSDCH